MSLVLSPQLPQTPVSLLPLSTKLRSRVPAVVYRIYCAAQHYGHFSWRVRWLTSYRYSVNHQYVFLFWGPSQWWKDSPSRSSEEETLIEGTKERIPWHHQVKVGHAHWHSRHEKGVHVPSRRDVKLRRRSPMETDMGVLDLAVAIRSPLMRVMAIL